MARARGYPSAPLSSDDGGSTVPAMRAVLVALVVVMISVLRSRASLHLEVLALRHQLAVLQEGGPRPRLKPADRLLWVWLSRGWSDWQDALVLVKPRTVVSWQRKRFRDHWTRLSRRGRPGRPRIAKEVRDLIRKISESNPSWGSPRSWGELRKLGIEVAKSTVEKYRVRRPNGTSPLWRAFLANHARGLVSLVSRSNTRNFPPLFTFCARRFKWGYAVRLGQSCHTRASMGALQVVTILLRLLLQRRAELAAENLASYYRKLWIRRSES